MPTTRNRALLGMTFAALYVVFSTCMYDGREYLATGDGIQLAQMAADALGLVLAVVCLGWPERRLGLQFATSTGLRNLNA